jgi:hypothetical protein
MGIHSHQHFGATTEWCHDEPWDSVRSIDDKGEGGEENGGTTETDRSDGED